MVFFGCFACSCFSWWSLIFLVPQYFLRPLFQLLLILQLRLVTPIFMCFPPLTFIFFITFLILHHKSWGCPSSILILRNPTLLTQIAVLCLVPPCRFLIFLHAQPLIKHVLLFHYLFSNRSLYSAAKFFGWLPGAFNFFRHGLEIITFEAL